MPAGGLLLHPFTLTLRTNPKGGLLSVALSGDHSPWELPSVLPCGARTFLPGHEGRGDDLSDSVHILITADQGVKTPAT